MINEEIRFPVYRKLFNGKSFYKVISAKEMVEIQILGERREVYQINAAKYPEQLLIIDIVGLKDGIYIEINSEEFEKLG